MKTFLPFLTNDAGATLDVQNGVVVTTGLPTPLENSPEGWEVNTLQFARNNEFRGVIKSYTTSLKFYLEGAKILRNAFYRLGMETVLYFIWLKLDQSFGGNMTYRSWYKGEPDFGTFKDEYDGVTINITEGGFYKDLQANKGVTYEMPFDEDAVQLYDDGIILHQSLNYSDIADLEVSIVNYSQRFFGPYTYLSQDGSSAGFLVHSQELEERPSVFADAMASDNCIIQNLTPKPVAVNISGVVEFICTGMVSSPAWAMRFQFATSFMTIADYNTLYHYAETIAMVVGRKYTFPFSVDITLQPQEKLFRVGTFFGGVGSDATIKFTDQSVSKISFETRQPATIINCYRAIDLGKKLSIKMSANSTLTSPLLVDDYNLLISSGDSIRSLPTATIKSTFSDWHKSIDAVKCIALNVVDNNPVVTSRYDSFNNTTITNLGECVNWTLQPADEYIYDSAAIGYPAKSSDANIDVNGKYSFNNTSKYKLDVTRRKVNEYQAVSAYYADPYDIELIRVNTNGKDTTSVNTDNDCFFFDSELKTDAIFDGTFSFVTGANTIRLHAGDTSSIAPYIVKGSKIEIGILGIFTITDIVDRNDFTDMTFTVSEYIPDTFDTIGIGSLVKLYQLRRLPYTTIIGVPDDGSVYNIEISPARVGRNHWRWLRSSFDHLDSHFFNFLSTDKNKELSTTDSLGQVIEEKANIFIGTMGDKCYLPYLMIFQVASPLNLSELISSNNGGKFNFTRQGQAMEGFPVQVTSEEAFLETQEYTLLCTANNNLLDCINGR